MVCLLLRMDGMESNDTGVVKKRGRPKGSKNKPKPRKQGRPKGSKSSYTVSEKALAQRQNNAKIFHAETDEERAFNAREIEHIIRVNEIASHADRNDLLSLKSCFIAYLKLCQEDGFKVMNLSAYASMGMDFVTFHNFAKRNNPEVKEFVRFVRTTCAMFRESSISENKLNPVIGIFWQRNFDGLRNDTEQIQAVNEQEDEFTSKGYKDKYRKLIGEET